MGLLLLRAPRRRAAFGLCRLALAGVVLAGAGWPLPAAAAPAAGRNAVKAVMIYNIIRFMTLPDVHGRVRLCVRRNDDIAVDLMDLAGQPMGAESLDVVTLGALPDGGHGCDVIYAGDMKAAGLAPGHGQVLIGDGADFVDDGGTVGLLSFGGQIRFAINARVASRCGIRVSSQLMRLAARIVN